MRKRINRITKLILVLVSGVLLSCNVGSGKLKSPEVLNTFGNKEKSKEVKMEVATLAGGCFWCTEAQYLALDGIEKVVSGYSGGDTKNPTYKEICTGTTGHAECVQITYDVSKITYEGILAAFFQAHDPTQLNRQGNDVGTQYRSAIFAHNPEQLKIAQDIVAKLNAEKAYDKEVVTQVEMLDIFYAAEDYHQNYYAEKGQTNGYCTMVVGPKLEKFKKVFKDKLKK